MSYTKNPNMPKVRMQAVRMLKQGYSTRQVARHFGYSYSSVSRWAKRYREEYLSLNTHLQTRSSRPHHHPRELPQDIIEAIREERLKHNRCAEIVHEDLKEQEVSVSLSSVKRTLKREGLIKQKSPWKRYRPFVPRPLALYPGALIQLDTIHFVRSDGTRYYIYTLIDLYSRFAYAEYTEKFSQVNSLKFVLKAQKLAGFRFKVIQTDNGPEFGRWFADELRYKGATLRHSRVRKPNDNAHIERFNRTIQEECGELWIEKGIEIRIKSYLDYYNNERRHLGIGLKTPAQVLQRY
jgi:transposase InsO family protein